MTNGEWLGAFGLEYAPWVYAPWAPWCAFSRPFRTCPGKRTGFCAARTYAVTLWIWSLESIQGLRSHRFGRSCQVAW
jgi:hypothetical protein